MRTPKESKKLSPVGTGSFGLVIERPFAALLEITNETPLGIATDGQSLLLRPLHKGKDKNVRFLMTKNLITIHKSLLLIIDRSILDLLGIDPLKDEMNVLSDGTSLVVKRADADPNDSVAIGSAIDEVVSNRVTFMHATEPDLNLARNLNREFYRLARRLRAKHGDVRAGYLTTEDKELLRSLRAQAQDLSDIRREAVVGRIDALMAGRLILRTDETPEAEAS